MCVFLRLLFWVAIGAGFAANANAAQQEGYSIQSPGSQPRLHELESPAFYSAENSHGLTLRSAQATALANNPTIVQALAQVDAAKGAAFQAGLRPNPNVGYVAEQIGVNGTAGELQGGFISQEIVRGNKLALSKSKYCQRVQIAETNLLAQQIRVRNDVAMRFYHALAAQDMLQIHRRVVTTAADNVQTHKEMLNLGQLGEAEVLQAEVEMHREQLKLRTAENDLDQSWRDLMAFIGKPDNQMMPLIGSLDLVESPLDWQTAIGQLISSSPQLVAAHQKIRHDQIAVQRERVEPIPNLTVDVTVGRNTEVGQTVAGVSVGLPLPVFNRNQGTVRQAQADLWRSHAEVKRLELELRSELAKQYRDYTSAWQKIQEYQQSMLPKSREAINKLEEMYKARRAPWLSVLSAKRMLLDLELEHVNNKLDYLNADVAIRGQLLMGGLTEPDGPISGGHIDAVAQPR